jgi:hypothetical protein
VISCSLSPPFALAFCRAHLALVAGGAADRRGEVDGPDAAAGGADGVRAVRGKKGTTEYTADTERRQRPGEKLRGVEVAALQLSEKDRSLFLGASAAHDVAAVHGLLLLLGGPGVLVAE